METVSGGLVEDREESFIVVYRSAKYNGLLHRTLQYISTYCRFYLFQPIVTSFSKFRQLLYEILGFFILLLLIPFLLISFSVLYIVRSLRTNLVKIFYPTAVICEDFQPRCILLGRSLGMVTSVVWVRGKLDAEGVIKHFQASLCDDSILKKRLADKFGVRVWLDSPVNFDFKNHIMVAPRKFYNLPITDAEGSHSHYGNKSTLQKYVTSCASQKLDFDKSPWQIFLIPQIVTEKQRTCCVFRFHYILLNDPVVRKTLEGLFTQTLLQQEDIWKGFGTEKCSRKLIGARSSNESVQVFLNENHPKLEEYVCLQENISGKEERRKDEKMDMGENTQENVLDEPVERIKSFRKSLVTRSTAWVRQNLVITRSELNSWMALRRKQYRFHNQGDLLYIMRLEILARFTVAIEFLKNIPRQRIWTDLKGAFGAAFLIFRACCDIPIEIIRCLVYTNHLSGNAFQKSEKSSTRQISWSAPLSMDVVEAIKEKTDCSLESIVLTAFALALKFYYLEMSLPNPKTVGVAVPSLSGDLLSPTGFRHLDLQTSDFNIPYLLRKVQSVLSEYPPWKLIGTYYIFKYISYFLPRSLAYVITRKFMKRYPLAFNFANLESPLPVPLPHISLWGQTVDEFTFWRAPQSDFCVTATLVKYGGILKLAVSSPMKSVDTALTQKFSSHLNAIAEAVGVEKHKIPYSRKSSPASSICSSPSILKASF